MTTIYHITHIENIPSILSEGGLHCDQTRLHREIGCRGIAHNHIKQRRAKRLVPVAPGGTLADYVPFYFAPRSPMLYAINMGAVEGYSGGQGSVLHLVASAEAVRDRGLGFAFTDGHAAMAYTEFATDLADLTRIDWPLMQAIYWNDTSQDNDRSRRRQAEFLIRDFASWDLIETIGVQTDIVASKVTAMIQRRKGHKPEIVVKPTWYY